MTTQTLPRLHRADGPAALVAALDKAGAAIVLDLVAAPEICSILEEVGPHVEAADPEMAHINDVLKEFFQGVRNGT